MRVRTGITFMEIGSRIPRNFKANKTKFEIFGLDVLSFNSKDEPDVGLEPTTTRLRALRSTD